MKQLRLLYPYNTPNNYQFFTQGFADEIAKTGVSVVDALNISRNVRIAIAKLRISRNFKCLSKDKYLIVCCGGYIDNAAFPFGYANNVIPIIWDSWPKYWDRLIASFKRHNIRLAFFTQGQTAKFVEKQLPEVKCVHIPEGLSSQGYKIGNLLKNRSIDVLELGRLYLPIHNELLKIKDEVNLQFAKGKLLFKDQDALTDGLAATKIVVNFPRCITHPEMAGSIETLTQRYWECMYSRCVMLGHAPQELIDLLGFNPVVEIDEKNALETVREILNNIDSYQEIVDKNYEVAKKMGGWENRIPILRKYICEVVGCEL